MTLHLLPCLGSEELAVSRRNELDIDREYARGLG